MNTRLPPTIDKDYGDDTALDFAWLRKRAVELVQQYSGNTWTDYNLHDPGVTILEMLCFALTDLAYRTSMPVADLLTTEKDGINYTTNSFITREKILVTEPVSVSDYRRWIIDQVNEVDNIWFEPIVSPYTKHFARGRYRVIVQLYDKWQRGEGRVEEKFAESQQIIERVKALLAEARNIGEEFEEFIVMQPERITVCAEIMLNKKAIPEDTLAQIYYRLENALNPPVLFSTEKEMQSAGYTVEEIYAGPLLDHGIVPESELRRMRTTADPAELIKAISGMEDVLHIRRLEVAGPDGNYIIYPLQLQKYHYPLLIFKPHEPDIKLYYDEQPLAVNGPVFESLLMRLREGMQRQFVADMHDKKTTEAWQGEWRNTEAYTSLQHYFPAIYRLGHEQVQEHDAPEQKARVKQLKAYLMLFEQTIAGYLSQLSHLSELYSYETTQEQTYFHQPLYQVPGVSDIIKAYTDNDKQSWEQFVADADNAYAATLRRIAETDDVYRKRKKRSLEHMLSRFNIVPDPYPVMLYNQYYGGRGKTERTDTEIRWKAQLLQHARVINNYRIRAENYLDWGVDEVSYGFSYNMRLLLYLQQRGTYRATAVLEKGAGETGRPHTPQPAFYRTWETGEEQPIAVWVDENMPVDSGFYLHKVPVSFLRSGIDTSRFRVLQHPVYHTEYIVAMPAKQQEEWQAVSRHSTQAGAVLALRVLADKLRAWNVSAEGFHLVEHILLAPLHGNNVYRYEFYDEHEQLLLRQRSWVAWQEREEAIDALLKLERDMRVKPALSDDEEDAKNRKWVQRVLETNHVFLARSREHAPAEVHSWEGMTDDMRRILPGKLRYALQAYRRRRTNFYPRFSYRVQRSPGVVIKEEFYNAMVTVVFPAWPARFQDKGFREFAEALFTYNLPAHIQPVFLWLNAGPMKQFEQLHSAWREALKNGREAIAHGHADRLISFLLDKHDYGLL